MCSAGRYQCFTAIRLEADSNDLRSTRTQDSHVSDSDLTRAVELKRFAYQIVEKNTAVPVNTNVLHLIPLGENFIKIISHIQGARECHSTCYNFLIQ